MIGEEKYKIARSARRGAVLVTAHIGAFESGMAFLREQEPRVRVVFKRDPSSLFEQLRSAQRRRLGVVEMPVDDGLRTWAALRDALLDDEVALFQCDRVMPGQPGVEVPFLGGHLRVPIGPVKLARLTGSPIVPVFTTVGKQRRIDVELCEALWPADYPEPAPGEIDPMLTQIVGHVERVVLAHPEQWLCLHPVLSEDRTT